METIMDASQFRDLHDLDRVLGVIRSNVSGSSCENREGL
jgi:hypothetical protein